MLKNFFTFFASLFSVVFYSAAQIPSPLIFSRITKKEGLASNTTFATTTDKKGFLWIATQNGLQRYDGNRFLTFRHIPGNALSIPENTISRLFIDSKERLWLLFNKNAGIFNTTNLSYGDAKVDSSVVQVKKIMEDGEGRIILFADNKRFVYNEKQNAFNTEYPLPPLPSGYTITDMTVDPFTGLYWFSGKQGLLLYDPKTNRFHSKEQNVIGSIELDSLGTVTNARYPFVARDSTWWLVNWVPFSGSPPILYHYDKKENRLQRFERIRPYKNTETYYEIWRIFQQSNGTIWVYGMGLLAYYNPQEKRFINIDKDPFQQYGIDYEFVSSLYEDEERNVWVSTNKGIYRFNVNAQVFRNIPNKRFNDTTRISNVVSAIVETKSNDIWVSTWGGGVFSYNNQLQPIPNPVTAADPLNKGMNASCMIQRDNGQIWLSTQSGELKIYDVATGIYSSLKPALFREEIITQLTEDYDQNIWLGTTSGLLVKCEKGNWRDTAHSFTTVLENAGDVMKFYEDNNHHLWVCTATSGVYEMDIRSNKVIKQIKAGDDKQPGLLNDGATDIVQYNDSIYLIASDQVCVFNYKTNSFRYLTSADGLPAEHISAFVIDKQKRIWVALDGGLYRLNIDSKLYVLYDLADGITSNVFQVSAATLLRDGRIAIGTPHDFVVFDPEKVVDKKEVPVVNITGITLGSSFLSVDSITQLNKLELPYDNTFISIDLSTLSFRDSYYMYYMLEGLDKAWKRVYNKQITYHYLPPGTYTLKLKSQNGDGIESKAITTLRIEVKPPFWKTWWFYCLLALLAGGLLFWIDHRRIQRKTAILKMRSDIADDLHQDISATLSNITILSQMAKMKADREPGKSKEFIEQIHTKSQNMTVAMDDILWSIDPNNDSMQNFMLRFKEYIDGLRKEYNVEIDTLIDKKAENLQLKMQMRNDIFSLFKSGITNMVKAGGTNCRIHITYEKPNLIYTLEFNTPTANMEQINNIRQRNELMERLEELNATLEFKEQSTNAMFVLNIPVKRDRL